MSGRELITRETIVDRTSPSTMGIIQSGPASLYFTHTAHTSTILMPIEYKIVEVADIALWHIEQHYDFREAGGSTDRYWNVDTRGPKVSPEGWFADIAPHAHCPDVVHRVIDRVHALVRYSRPPSVDGRGSPPIIPFGDRTVGDGVTDDTAAIQAATAVHMIGRVPPSLGIVEIYVAEMIPAEARAVALDACLHNDRESLRCAGQICDEHAATITLARLALETIVVEAGIARKREQTAAYQ